MLRVEFDHAKENSGGTAWYLTKRNLGMAGPFGQKQKRTNNTSESINVPIPKVPLTPLSIIKHPVHPMTKMETRKSMEAHVIPDSVKQVCIEEEDALTDVQFP